jgi:predicted esterase
MGTTLAAGFVACSSDSDQASNGAGASAPATSSSSSSGASTTGATSGGAAGGGGAPDEDAGSDSGISWDAALDPDAGPSSMRLTPRPLGSTAAPQGFYEYLPPGYPGGAHWPLLFALHGIGENGDGSTQLDNVINVGIGKLIENDAWPNDRPFVVLIPQHSGGDCPNAAEIQSFIAWGMESYDIEPKQVYLTGLSCGAIGSWDYLAQNLDSQIAAMVPIAGDGKGAWGAKMCDLAKVAIWAFHGDADPTVDVSGTNVPMDGLAGCPSPPAKENKKTIYPGVGHDSWDQTYDLSAGNDIYTWMLGFTHD